MAKATSNHFIAAKFGAEVHNERQKDLSYVRKELSYLNQTWKHPDFTTVADAWQRVAKRYQNAKGKKYPNNSTPIQETAVVLSEDTTMEQLLDLANKIEEVWGYTCLAIYTHMDEGHKKSKTWKPNLHAHMIFDTADEKGESLKPIPESQKRSTQHKWEKKELEAAKKEGREPRPFIPPKEFNRVSYDILQDLTAEALGMERGKKSNRKWLNSLEFKIKKQEERLAELEKETESLEAEKKEIIDFTRTDLLTLNSAQHQYAKDICKTFDEVDKEDTADITEEERATRFELERESQENLRSMNRQLLLQHFHAVSELIQKTQKAITRAVKSIASFFNVENLFDKLNQQEAELQEKDEKIKELERQLQQQRRGMGPRR